MAPLDVILSCSLPVFIHKDTKHIETQEILRIHSSGPSNI